MENPVQQLINHVLEPLQTQRLKLRWVPAENRHMTLAFLGDIRANELEIVGQGFARAYTGKGQFQYRLTALERFPNSRGRIIALTGGANKSLLDLAIATREMLVECGLGYERKKFKPHITLARIRNPKHPVTGFDRKLSLGMDIKRVVLYRSTLTEYGSTYSELMDLPLL